MTVHRLSAAVMFLKLSSLKKKSKNLEGGRGEKTECSVWHVYYIFGKKREGIMKKMKKREKKKKAQQPP